MVGQFVSYQDEESWIRYELAIALASTGELVGSAGIGIVSASDREAPWVTSCAETNRERDAYRGRSREMLRLGFELLDTHRLIGAVDAEKTGSVKLLENLGVTRERML